MAKTPIRFAKPRSVARRYKPYEKKRYNFRRATASFSPMLSLGSGVTGFPLNLVTKLRYREAIGLSSVSGTVVQNIFRANSLFDPNESGTGHQPMYFDQLAAVYSRYVVKAAEIIVTFNVVTETAATSMFLVGIVGQLGGALGSDPSTVCEQGHNVWAAANGRNGSTGQRKLRLKYTPESCLNLTYKDTDAGAAVGTNPDQTYKFIIWAADRQATGTTQVLAEVEILYTCEFSQRANSAGS